MGERKIDILSMRDWAGNSKSFPLSSASNQSVRIPRKAMKELILHSPEIISNLLEMLRSKGIKVQKWWAGRDLNTCPLYC